MKRFAIQEKNPLDQKIGLQNNIISTLSRDLGEFQKFLRLA